MEPSWNGTSAFLETFKARIPNHCVPTWIIARISWWYLRISRRKWNSLNFIRASGSWYRHSSIPFFWNNKEVMSPFAWCRQNTPSGRPYHKTISIVLAASLLQVRHHQRLYPDNVCHHINKAWHGEIVRDDGLAQCRTTRHPVPSLCTLQTIYHKLCHDNWSRLPNTDAAVCWRQRFNSRRSKVGCSTSFARYPLPR